MKTKTQILFFVLTILIVVSCRKGEEDPAFSFRTRKNRVVGDWHIKSGTTKYVETNANGNIIYTEDFTFTKHNYVLTQGNGNNSLMYEGGHSYKMIFDKNGEVSTLEIFDGIASSYKGKWNFNGGVGEAKAKEEINIHYTSVDNQNGANVFGGNQINNTYKILELRNKLMRIKAEYTVYNDDGTSISYTETYELIQ